MRYIKLIVMVILAITFSFYSSNVNSQCNSTSTPINITNGNISTSQLNQNYNVTGVLTITASTNITISNCKFVMSPNATINVVGGFTVTFQNSCFEGTTAMWDRMEVALGTSVVMTSCVIKDAEVGLRAYSQLNPFGPVSSIRIKGCNFLQNLTGISLGHNQSAGFGLINFSLSSTNIGGNTTPLLPNNTSNTYSRVGLHARGVLNISTASLNGTNTFHDLEYYGILAEVVYSMFVAKCKFVEIHTLSTPISSRAIYSTDNMNGGRLNVIGFGSSASSPLTFENCMLGVQTQNINCSIKQCKFDVFSAGIAINGPNYNGNVSSLHKIENNRIYTSGEPTFGWSYGINVINSEPYAAGSFIRQNHIEIDCSIPSVLNHSYGIAVEGITNNQGSSLDIMSNQIILTKGTTGIRCSQGVSNSNISGNEIQVTYLSPAVNPNNLVLRGLYFDNCRQNQITCNSVTSNVGLGGGTVLSTSSSVVYPIGLDVNSCEEQRIIYNKFRNLGTGMHFDQNNDFTDIVGNYLYDNTNGLMCGPNNCILNQGQQTSTGNQWNMNPPVTGSFYAKHFGGPFQIANSIFKFNPNDPLSFQPLGAPGVFPPTGWFFVDPLIIQAYPTIENNYINVCGNYTPGPMLAISQQVNDAIYDQAMENDPTSLFPDVQIEKAQEDMFEILEENIMLRNSRSDYLSFYANNYNGAIGQYSKVKKAIEDLQGNVSSDMYFYFIDLDGMIEELSTLHSVIHDTDSTQSPLIVEATQQYNNLIQELRENAVWIQNYINVKKLEQAGLKSNLQTMIQNLPVNNNYEEYHKTMYTILANTIMQGNYTFTASQKQQIETIGVLCPLAGGEAVNLARGLWQMYNDGASTLPYIELCEGQGYATRGISETRTESGLFKVYPNPANTMINISVPISSEKITVSLYNLTGSLVYTSTQNANMTNLHSFNLPHLSEGIYTLQIDNFQGVKEIQKLIIKKL